MRRSHPEGGAPTVRVAKINQLSKGSAVLREKALISSSPPPERRRLGGILSRCEAVRRSHPEGGAPTVGVAKINQLSKGSAVLREKALISSSPPPERHRLGGSYLVAKIIELSKGSVVL